jgi:hypothetical protein
MPKTYRVFAVYDRDNNLLKVFTDKTEGIKTMLSWGIEAELRTHRGLTQEQIKNLKKGETKNV